MNLWVDAQLAPALAPWITTVLGVSAQSLRALGLQGATDREIFARARTLDVVLLTKDSDFVTLLEQLGAPPRVLWLTMGNTSNARVREVLLARWSRIIELFEAGEPLVEIQG